MIPQFTINLRREAQRREASRSRKRALMLGLWLSYFGLLSVIVGFYGLNWGSLVTRTRQIERRTAAMRALQDRGGPWNGGPTDAVELERYVTNPRRWRDRLARLAEMLPPDVRITSVVLNPGTAAGAADPKLVITGEARTAARQDRLQSVMSLVAAIRRDSLFAVDYANVRLASTRFSQMSGTSTEFVLECQ